MLKKNLIPPFRIKIGDTIQLPEGKFIIEDLPGTIASTQFQPSPFWFVARGHWVGMESPHINDISPKYIGWLKAKRKWVMLEYGEWFK